MINERQLHLETFPSLLILNLGGENVQYSCPRYLRRPTQIVILSTGVLVGPIRALTNLHFRVNSDGQPLCHTRC
jgi:hypothetical protein